ncbi:MAG: helix-turn-helix domain-containing protein [Clostridia bacterium]|nr:helix-turn-helix domain-containing protein [Clostridia bacterium]
MYDLGLIGGRIKEIRKEKDMTLEDVARRIGVAKSTIQRYEAGLISSPKQPVLAAMAKAFNVKEEWLCGMSNDKETQSVEAFDDGMIPIPVLGEVSAGMGKCANDNITGYIFEEKDSISDDCEYVYLKVSGDSMYPEFKDGDLVFVKCQPSVESGSYAVVMVDSELGMVKKVFYGNNFVELHSVNPMYPPKRFEGEDVLRVRVFGLVKGMKRVF